VARRTRKRLRKKHPETEASTKIDSLIETQIDGTFLEDASECSSSDETLNNAKVKSGMMIAVTSSQDDRKTPFWVGRIVSKRKKTTEIHWFDSRRPFSRYKPCFADRAKKIRFTQDVPNNIHVMAYGFALSDSDEIPADAVLKIKSDKQYREFYEELCQQTRVMRTRRSPISSCSVATACG